MPKWIDRRLAEVNIIKDYGLKGLDTFRIRNSLRRLEGADESLDEQLANFYELPTTAHTQFFRQHNMDVFAEKIARPLLERSGMPVLEVIQAGCGPGHETWSLAALLMEQDIPFQIHATDVSREVLEIASTARYHRESLRWHDQYSRLARFFEPADEEGFLQPIQALRERVTFEQVNLLSQPLPPNHHALIINNVLHWYPKRSRARIVGNALAGLAQGGAFIYEAGECMGLPREYYSWGDELEQKFGLKPMPEAGDLKAQIRQYVGTTALAARP